MASMTPATESSYAYCEAFLREADKDRYLANLFAPQEKRHHLNALYALSAEVSGIRDKVTDPMPGEIRMQWWMDALSGKANGEIAANPIVAATRDTIDRFSLPRKPLVDMVDARVFDLYDDPMPTLQDLVGYAGETCSALMQLAAIVLNDGDPPSTSDIAGHGGVAVTMARILVALPHHVARGQVFIPLDILDAHDLTRDDIVTRRTTPQIKLALKAFREAASDHVEAMGAYVDQIPRNVAAAFLPTALVRHYLSAGCKIADPLNERIELAQWRRQLILWRAARQADRIATA